MMMKRMIVMISWSGPINQKYSPGPTETICGANVREKKHWQRHNRSKTLSLLTLLSALFLSTSFKSWLNFNLALFGKGREIHLTTWTNPCNNFY